MAGVDSRGSTKEERGPPHGSAPRAGLQPGLLFGLDARTLRLGLLVFVCSLAGTLLAVSLWALDPSACDLVQINSLQGASVAGGTATPDPLERCRSGKAPVAEAVELRAGGFPKLRFERCALVGSSPVLRGRGRGFEIDRHDTVIRVNRVPQQRFYEDYGQRTDVLFVGPGWKGHEIFGRQGIRVEVMGEAAFKEAELCPYAGGPACRFAALVLTALPIGYPFDKPGWRPNITAFPFGVQGPVSVDVADGFAGFHTRAAPNSWTRKIPWPTNGFYSLATFAPICTTLELFGFGGSGTADGHGIDGGLHNLSYDHYLMDGIMSGELNASEWSGSLLEEEREARRVWMEQFLLDRGRRGCITASPG